MSSSALGVVHAFGGLRPALVRRGDELPGRAAISTTFEPALLKRVKNFSLHGCIRRPMGRASWADGTAVRGAPPLRVEVVRPERTI
jgi:hypothetical protein